MKKRRKKYDNGDGVKKDGGFKGDRLKDDLDYYDYLQETFPKDSQGKPIYTKDIFPSYRDAYQTVNQQTKEYLSSPVYRERLMKTNNFTSEEADYYIESRLYQLEKHDNPNTIREYLGSPPGTEFVPGTMGWSGSPLSTSNARPSQIHMNIPGILDQEYRDAVGGTPSYRDFMGYYMNPLQTPSNVEDIYQHELAHSAMGAANSNHFFNEVIPQSFLNLTKKEEELLKPDKTKANKNYRKKTHIRKPHEQAADIQGFRNFLRKNLKVDGKSFSPDMEVTEEMLQKIYDRDDLPLQPGRLKERYTLPKLVEILNNYAVNEEPSMQMAENGDDVEKEDFVYTSPTVDPNIYSTTTPSGQRSAEMDEIDEFYRKSLNSPIYKKRLGLQGSIRDVDSENFYFHPDHGVVNRDQVKELNSEWYNDDMFQQLRVNLPFQSWHGDKKNQRNQLKVDETIENRLNALNTMTTDYSSEYDNQLYDKVHHVGDEVQRLADYHGIERDEDGSYDMKKLKKLMPYNLQEDFRFAIQPKSDRTGKWLGSYSNTAPRFNTPTGFTDMDGNIEYSSNERPVSMQMTPSQIQQSADEAGISYEDMEARVYAHEVSHSLGAVYAPEYWNYGVNSPQQGIGAGRFANQNYSINDNEAELLRQLQKDNYGVDVRRGDKEDDHVSEDPYQRGATEAKADMDAVRYDMYKRGIYDYREGDLNQETLDKYLNLYKNEEGKIDLEKTPLDLQRTLERYKQRDFIFLNNNIALDAESGDPNIQMAEDGDEVKSGQIPFPFVDKSPTIENAKKLTDSPFANLPQSYLDNAAELSAQQPDPGVIKSSVPFDPNSQWISSLIPGATPGSEYARSRESFYTNLMGMLAPIPLIEGVQLTKAIRTPGIVDDLILGPGAKAISKIKESVTSSTLPEIKLPEGTTPEDAYQTQRIVENSVKKRKDYISSDEYLQKRMANTGETAEEVNDAVLRYLNELDNSTITYKPIDAQGQYTRDNIEMNAPADDPFYMRNRGTESRTLEHEIDHMLSPISKPNPKAPTKYTKDVKLTKEYKDFLLAGNRPTEGGVTGQGVKHGAYKDYPTLEINPIFKESKYTFDSGANQYEYLMNPAEQQARHLGAADHLKKYYGWDGTEAGLTDDMLEGFRTDLKPDYYGQTSLHDVRQIYSNLVDGSGNVIGSHIFMPKGKIVKDPKTGDFISGDVAFDNWKKQIRKILPKAWSISGAAVGANKIAGEDNSYQDGDNVKKKLPSAKDLDYNKLYEAIMMSEHNNYLGQMFDDKLYSPWIRTQTSPPGGSTAYGPVQIGSGLLKTYLDPYHAKKAGMNPEDIKTLQSLRAQGLEFSKHGNEKGNIPDYNPVFDYGGSGTFTDKSGYKKVATKMLTDMVNRRNDGDVYNMLESWRGPTSPELLKEYISKIEDYYYNPIEYSTPDSKSSSISKSSLDAVKRGIAPSIIPGDLQINELRKSLNIK